MDIIWKQKSTGQPDIKHIVERRKKLIQTRCREELSLLVDFPKQGFGNTNDGNTARRAFEDAEIFLDITGVKVELIVCFRTILNAVFSGFSLNSEAVTKYCLETTDLIIKEYNWFVIPPSVHKLLEHCVQVSSSLELPIGFYSGVLESSEQRN